MGIVCRKIFRRATRYCATGAIPEFVKEYLFSFLLLFSTVVLHFLSKNEHNLHCISQDILKITIFDQFLWKAPDRRTDEQRTWVHLYDQSVSVGPKTRANLWGIKRIPNPDTMGYGLNQKYIDLFQAHPQVRIFFYLIFPSVVMYLIRIIFTHSGFRK